MDVVEHHLSQSLGLFEHALNALAQVYLADVLAQGLHTVGFHPNQENLDRVPIHLVRQVLLLQVELSGTFVADEWFDGIVDSQDVTCACLPERLQKLIAEFQKLLVSSFLGNLLRQQLEAGDVPLALVLELLKDGGVAQLHLLSKLLNDGLD